MTSSMLPSNFTPPPSYFQSVISPDPASEFPGQPGRYALYLHLGYPFAHRTNIVYHLKHLQPLMALSIVSIHREGENRWSYDGTSGSDVVDPIERFKNFKELYEKVEPGYQGSYSVPLIWDRKRKTIVSNGSAEIIHMIFTAFDALLAPELREVNKPGVDCFQAPSERIDYLVNEIESDINWGTYKCGMVGSQEEYDKAMKCLFGRLGGLEKILGESKYLLGDHITEPDIRLFPTIVGFDVGYYTIFNCNWKQIRYDYPNLHQWLRELYYEVGEESKGAFKSTTFLIFHEWLCQICNDIDTRTLGTIYSNYAIGCLKTKICML